MIQIGKKTDKKMVARIEILTVEDVQVTDQEIVKTLNIASGSVLRTLKCQSDYRKVCAERTPTF